MEPTAMKRTAQYTRRSRVRMTLTQLGDGYIQAYIALQSSAETNLTSM